jgi:hypothetical protein
VTTIRRGQDDEARLLGRAWQVLARIRRPLPASITLVPGIGPGARPSGRAARLLTELRLLGLRDVGSFRIAEIPGGRVDLVLSRDGTRAGAVYFHPQVGSWAEVLARLDDGRTVLVSAAPAGHRRPEAPMHHRVCRLGAEPARLLQELERQTPPGRHPVPFRRRTLAGILGELYSGEASPQRLGL